MTTGKPHDERFSRGARNWARLTEPHFHPIYQAVHDRLAVGQETRLLDVGCGPGGAALLAAGRGARVAGLDAAPASIEVARERVPEGNFRVGDMETLPWPDASFDAVTGFNSFQFAGNPVNALTEARRVLVSGARLGMVIWAPPAQSEQPRVLLAAAALAPPQPPGAPGPFALSAPGMAESVLEQAGLRLVETGEMPEHVEYPDAETACGAMMEGSGPRRAIQHVGEERVRQVMLEALEQFRTESGGYRMVNRFRFLIAE